jgi:predicted kinase
MRLLLLCGPAFSGKTTLSRVLEAHGLVRISLDDVLRSRGLEPGAGLPDRAWQDASFAACLLITAAAQRGQDVVLDDTLCFRSLRDRYRELGSGANMSVFLVVLKISAVAVRERVAGNLRSPQRHGIDEALLESHLASFEWPGADEPHIELDGTSSVETQLSRLRQAVVASQKNS